MKNDSPTFSSRRTRKDVINVVNSTSILEINRNYQISSAILCQKKKIDWRRQQMTVRETYGMGGELVGAVLWWKTLENRGPRDTGDFDQSLEKRIRSIGKRSRDRLWIIDRSLPRPAPYRSKLACYQTRVFGPY